MTTPLTFQQGTHVALDLPTAERLTSLGVSTLVRACDLLIVGPSRKDRGEHMHARQTWWSSVQYGDHLYAPDLRWETPIILWASTNLADRINLWRVCDWLQYKEIPISDVLVPEILPITPKRVPEDVIQCSASVADHVNLVLSEKLRRAQPFSRQRHDTAVGLWGKYTDPDILPLVRDCQRRVRSFPELPPLWALLSSFFPRQTVTNGLFLSRFDEVLLQGLSMEGRKTTGKLVFAPTAAGDQLRTFVTCVGQAFVSRRLEQWARHKSPAVESIAESDCDCGPSYKLTAHGAHLRAEGLRQLMDAPGLPIAGTEAYTGPWVLLDNGYLVRSSESD